MKTKITIEIETKDLNPVYDIENSDEWTDDNKVTDELDQQLHSSIERSIRYLIEESETLQDDFFDNVECIPESYDDFSNIGTVKISISQEILDKNTYEKED